MENWRDKVSKDIFEHLEVQINESTKYKEAYETAFDKGKAQLWVAIATLSKQIFDLNLKMNYLEGLLREFDKKVKDVQKDVEEGIKKIKIEKKGDKLITDVEKEMEEFVKEMPKLEEKKEELDIELKEQKKAKKKAKLTRIKKKLQGKRSRIIRPVKKDRVKKKSKIKKLKNKSFARILRKF